MILRHSTKPSMIINQQVYNAMPDKPLTAEQLFQIDYLICPSRYDHFGDDAANLNEKKKYSRVVYKQLDSFTKLDYMNSAEHELEQFQQKYQEWLFKYKEEAQKIEDALKLKEMPKQYTNARRQYLDKFKLDNSSHIQKSQQMITMAQQIAKIDNKIEKKNKNKSAVQQSKDEQLKINQQIMNLRGQKLILEKHIEDSSNQISVIDEDIKRLMTKLPKSVEQGDETIEIEIHFNQDDFR